MRTKVSVGDEIGQWTVREVLPIAPPLYKLRARVECKRCGAVIERRLDNVRALRTACKWPKGHPRPHRGAPPRQP